MDEALGGVQTWPYIGGHLCGASAASFKGAAGELRN